MQVPAEEYKIKGNDFFAKKDYKGAVEAYTKAIEQNPTVPIYYCNRSAAYYSLFNFSSALEDCKYAFALDPTLIKSYLRAGRCCLQLGEIDEAERYLLQTKKYDPENPLLMTELQNLENVKKELSAGHEALNNYEADKALAYFTGILVRYSQSRSAKRSCAKAYLYQKNVSKSLEIIRDLLHDDHQDEKTQLILAQAKHCSGNSDAALKILHQLLQLDPDSLKIRAVIKTIKDAAKNKELGDIAYKEKNYNDSIRYYSQALNIDPINDILNSKIFSNRAACHLALGNFQEAIDDCTKAINVDESYVKALIRRANCYSKLKCYQEAVNDWERIARLEPNNREYERNLRNAKYELKESLRKDYYSILEIDQQAGVDEIKKAYRRLALIYHPDKNNESEEAMALAESKFKDVTEAHSVLSDPEKRRRYDLGQDLDDEGVHMPGADIMSMFMGNRFSTSGHARSGERRNGNFTRQFFFPGEFANGFGFHANF